MAPKPKRLLARFSTFILLMAVLVTAGAVWQRQAVYDWWQLHGYVPPNEIAQFATDTTMTDKARRIYYVNRPELKDKQSFANFCPVNAEQTVVLGCYLSGQRGVYLLDVDNTELSGIKQVTAAHEMLHAAYERLSQDEKDRLTTILKAYYDTLPDGQIKKTVDSYTNAGPAELANEMHSIFGTQATDLPAELETHYARYFTDRQAVVKLYDAYEEAFTGRQNKIAEYDNQLAAWKPDIERLQSTIDAQQGELKSRNAQLNRSRNTGDLSAYNNGVDAYNSLVNTYNSNLTTLRNLVTKYNETIEARNAIAFEERALVDAISSTPVTQQ